MAKFQDIFTDKTSQGHKLQTSEYLKSGKYPIIDQGKEQIAGYTNSEDGIFFDVPAIIFGDHTRIIKYVDEPFFLGADGVKVLKCKMPDVDYKYLYYYLQNVHIPNIGYNRHFKWLKEAEFYIHPFDEQRKIAAVLDKISDLIAKRRRQLDKLDELVKSRFVEMFGDPVINEKNWPKYKISDFATVKIGPFGSMLHADDYVRGGHPLVNPSHISDGVIIPDFSLSLNVQKQEELVAYQLLPGDVIIGRRGEIGRCAVVKKSGMFCGTGCMFVRIFKDCRPDYLQCVISYPTFSSILEDKAVGVTMKNLNAGMVEDSNVYLPPLSMQDKFASFRAQVDTLKLRIGSSVDKLDTLKKSLMQEYFSVK